MTANLKPRHRRPIAWLGVICLAAAVGTALVAIRLGWGTMPSWSDMNAWASRWWPIVCAVLVLVGVALLALQSVNGSRPEVEMSAEVRPLSTRAIGATGLVLALTVFALIFALLFAFGQDERNALEAIKTAGTYVVAIGGGVALWLAARRQRSTEATLQEQMRAAQSTEEDATERRITALYTTAVEQLGSESAAIRLGGLYALERLAETYKEHQPVVLEVLCAYLRMLMPDYPVATGEEQPRDEGQRSQERLVRRAAFAILGRHRLKGILPEHFWKAEKYLPAERLNLSGAYLREAPLAETDFALTNFAGANLTSAKLRNATLTSANFTGADLRSADLAGADLAGANLTGAAMKGVNVTKLNWDSSTKWPDDVREFVEEQSTGYPDGRFKTSNRAIIP